MFRSQLGSTTEPEFGIPNLQWQSTNSTELHLRSRIQEFVMETKPLSIFQHEAPPCSLKYFVIYLGKNFATIVHVKKVTVSFSSKESWIAPLSYQSRTQGESFQTLKDFTKIHNWGQNLVSISCLRGLKPPGCKFSNRSNHFVKPNIPATWFRFSHC